MQTFTEFFGCRYPIVAVAMNQVSDVNLAIAVTQAGGFPSISIFNYHIARGVLGWDWIRAEIQRYKDAVGNCNFILSIGTELLLDQEKPKVIQIIDDFKISHVEIIAIDLHKENPEFLAAINHWRTYLQGTGVKLILKAVDYPLDIENWLSWGDHQKMDAIGLKGPGGAGRVMTTNMTLEEMVTRCFGDYPGIPVISVGGISNSDDVKRQLELGVMAVGVGTLFAAAKESPVSEEAKRKMISASVEQLSQLKTESPLNQNALKFGEWSGFDNTNHTLSLRAGIKDGEKGHIFAGKSIDAIKEILPAKDIIKNLFDEGN